MRVLSLFDGMSCGQIALQKLGAQVDQYDAYEIDNSAIKVTQDNFPRTIQNGSVEGADFTAHAGAHLLLAGSPCQGFSFAGKQLQFNDPRSRLFFDFVRALDQVKPKYFLLENVKMKKESQDVITKYLGVEPVEINSALVSAQNRKRLYWTNIPGVTQPEDRGIMLRDILEENPTQDMDHSPKAIAYMNREVKGGRTHWDFKHHSDSSQDKSAALVANLHKGVPYNVLVHYMSNPEKFEKTINYSSSGRGENGVEARASESDKAFTLTAKGYSTRSFTGVVAQADYRIRRLTVLECKRLQTVPDDYKMNVSNSRAYHMLGNGWTVDVIAHILRGSL